MLPELKIYCYDIVYALVLELFLFLVYLVKKLNYTDVYMEVFDELDEYFKEILKRCNFVIPRNKNSTVQNTDSQNNDDTDVENSKSEEEKIGITFFKYIDPRCVLAATADENNKFINTVDRSSPLSKLKGLLGLITLYKNKLDQFSEDSENDVKPKVNLQKLVEKEYKSNSNSPFNTKKQSYSSVSKVVDPNLKEKKELVKEKMNLKSFIFSKISYSNGDLFNFALVLKINIVLIAYGEFDIVQSLIYYLIWLQLLINFVFLAIYFKYTYSFKAKISGEQSNSSLDLDSLSKAKLNQPNKNEYKNYPAIISKLLSIFDKISSLSNQYVFKSFLFDEEIYYINICFVICLLCIILNAYISLLYSILLIGIIKFNDTSKGILLAFGVRKEQIISMVVFLFLIVNVFSSIAFFLMRDEYNINTEDTGNLTINVCSTLLSCEVAFFNHGVRAGGGIGDILNKKSEASGTTFWLRLATDLTFYILITLLIIQMFSGIIIETFGSLREDFEYQKDDKENSCLLCSVRKVEFKRRNIDITTHFKVEHNVEDYIKVLLTYMLLTDDDASNLDFNEKYIRDCIKNNKYSCFPISMICKDNEIIKINSE